MKKIVSLLILTVLVSSCGNRLTLMKRHYTKGYYVQSSSGAASSAVIKESSRKMVNVPMNPSTVKLAHAMAEPTMATSLRIAGQKGAIETSNPPVSISKSSEKKERTTYKGKRSSVQNAFKESQRGGGGDANIIVLVILSLFPFINLIAMYLHDGGITSNFWICLLLDVLFFLPGIIFALLVVLDLVNLA